MSGNSTFNSSVIAVACFAGLTLTACASSQPGSRYGSVYDYESGGNCSVNPCGPAIAAPTPVFTQPPQIIGGQTINQAPLYVDCSQIRVPDCAGPPIHSQPIPVAPPPLPVQWAPISCPAGTTPSGDGTCLMSSGHSNHVTTTTSSTMANCPTGTLRTHGGTCMLSEEKKPHIIINKGYTPPTNYVPPTTYLPIRK